MEPLFRNSSVMCSHLVNRYIFIGSNKMDLNDRFVPDGSISIVFNFLGNVEFSVNDKKISLPKYFVVTPNIEKVRINAIAPFDTMILNCNASVFSRLFNISWDKYSKSSYKEIELFQNSPLWNKLKEMKTIEEKIRSVECYLIENILPEKYEPDLIDIIYGEIISQECPEPIHKIIEKCGANPRTLRRNFLKRIGINAKSLARIVRTNYLWDQIKNVPGTDLYSIIYRCKFFDQAHFIKDFKNIIGETPQSFFNRDIHQVEIISGKLP